jgi:hypothetical protein
MEVDESVVCGKSIEEMAGLLLLLLKLSLIGSAESGDSSSLKPLT